MKLLKQSIAIFCATVLVVACNNNKSKTDEKTGSDSTQTKSSDASDKGSASKLEGTWEVKREDGQDKSDQVGSTYEFKGNTLTLNAFGMSNPGTTEVTDNTFSFLANGGKDKVMYNYHFDGDTLVVQMQDGPQIFHLVKK